MYDLMLIFSISHCQSPLHTPTTYELNFIKVRWQVLRNHYMERTRVTHFQQQVCMELVRNFNLYQSHLLIPPMGGGVTGHGFDQVAQVWLIFLHDIKFY